ncbi:sensor domain-containing diguanylate cyclase [Pseudomarimonas arenosa]|uniref:diguanylate cyclase n=1 Tax=Pseudomarimonas arenosa TaxID=2774145 RepID=A0AAW3ZPY5_9GAMM|nr:GGDEF domain-containing protein [Pseudomarimonas arenosa]
MRDFDRFLLTVVYDIPLLLFVVDPESGEIVYANQHTRSTLGEHCVGRSFAEVFPAGGGSHYFVSYTQRQDGDQDAAPPLRSEYYDDDSENWYHVLQRSIEWADGSSKYLILLNEINALKRLQKDLSEAHAAVAFKNRELEHAAKTDRLTHLYNRRHLDAILEQEMVRFRRFCKPFSLLIVDCDRFKQVNDQHGHQVGDIVLVHLARLLATGVRATDTVGRWGGEEFLIVLPETHLRSAALVAEKLRQSIDQHEFPVIGHITSSFGATELRGDEDIKDLVARADAALYKAKHNGRNRVEVMS